MAFQFSPFDAASNNGGSSFQGFSSHRSYGSRSASTSRSTSPLPDGVHDHARSHRRTRSRASSEANTPLTSTPLGQQSSSQQQRPRNHHRRSSSGIQAALALSRSRNGIDQTSDDEGVRGDDDEFGSHSNSRLAADSTRTDRYQPLRARSSPHLPIDTLHALATHAHIAPQIASSANGALSPSLRSLSAVSHPSPSQPDSLLHLPFAETQQAADLHRLSANHLLQLRQAAVLGVSPSELLGLGVTPPLSAHTEHTAHQGAEETHLADLLLPPPPYQASEDSEEARRARERDAINLLELQQAQASIGRRLQALSESHVDSNSAQSMPDDEGLSFRVGRRSGSEQTGSRAVNRDLPASIRRGGLRAAEQGGDDAGLPAWQPKDDNDGEEESHVHALENHDEPRETLGELHRPHQQGRRRTGRGSTTVRNRGDASQDTARSSMSVSPLAQQIAAVEEEEDFGTPPWLLQWLLHPLRLLAAVPGSVGTFWLIRNAWMHYQLSDGSLLKRGPLNPSQPDVSNPFRMTCGLDFILASLWACSTAYHALSLTTLLLRRWLVYYTLFPSLIRLIALQAICWPLVRLTIFVAGPDRPIEAWIVIASFTAFSDVVARWVTSNIADAPSDRRRKAGTAASATPQQAASASLTDATAQSPSAAFLPRQRGKLKAGQRFWRAVMGAPFDSSTSESESEDDDADRPGGDGVISASALEGIGRSGMTHILTRRIRNLRAATRAARAAGDHQGPEAHTPQSNASSPNLDGGDILSGPETDYDGETSDAGLTSGGGAGSLFPDEDEDDEDFDHRLRLALRRKKRRHRMRLKMAAISGQLRSGSAASRHPGRSGGLFSLFSKKATDDTMLLTSGELKVRIRNRRIFHWEVAVKRNVAPIGVLAYLTLWGLLLGGRER